jgi:MFS family permease
VNIALPAIGRDLHASVAGLQWTVDGYALVLASLLMLSGATADRIGRRRVFQVGLATFTAGSALCSLAPGLGWLVAFRMLQAIGGSMLNPVAMSIITNTFTDKTGRARATGVWGGAYGLSMSLGRLPAVCSSTLSAGEPVGTGHGGPHSRHLRHRRDENPACHRLIRLRAGAGQT